MARVAFGSTSAIRQRFDRSTPITMTPVPELEDARRAVPALPGHALPLGTRLREYEITGLVGEGTCSIVYLGWDHSLQLEVAIKEYMPAAMAARVAGTPTIVAPDRYVDSFRAGLAGFVEEARLLARLDHPSLVKVYRFWEDNGTAYMVMPHYEGPTLKTALAEFGRVPSEDELRAWLKPILNALTALHECGIWHQNIGPDEIVLTPVGPVLLGFASAAHAIEALHHTPAAALKAGFAAIEQYGSAAGSTRGPWTDLYSLAAVMYAAITGAEPVAAADRLSSDRLRPLSVIAAGLYSAGFLTAIDAAMAVQPKQRPADHAEFRALMGDIEAPEAGSLTPRRDPMQELFVGQATSEHVVTVADRPAAPRTEPPAPTVTSPPASAPKAPAAAREIPVTAAAPNHAERSTHSWMKHSKLRSISHRMQYGIVAGTCALISISALLVHFANEPAAIAAPRPTTQVAAPKPRPLPTPIAAPVVTAAAAARAPVAASTPERTPAPPQPPPPATATATATGTATATATTKPVTVAAAPASVAQPTGVAPGVPVEGRARCIEILQKASLEKITPAETDFFKRECK
jgi:serine/threonine protein kinase